MLSTLRSKSQGLRNVAKRSLTTVSTTKKLNEVNFIEKNSSFNKEVNNKLNATTNYSRKFSGLAGRENLKKVKVSDPTLQTFPSLRITKDSIEAQGTFAEQQKDFLFPCEDTAKQLANQLKEKNVGVVSHFYMDAELQGILVKTAEDWPHVFCSDSLAMGFAAVEMAKKGCKSIACLGVDFMAESVKATLNQNGFHHIPVFRLKKESIGCSLAESAEVLQYEAYLRQGSKLKKFITCYIY